MKSFTAVSVSSEGIIEEAVNSKSLKIMIADLEISLHIAYTLI